MCRHDDDDSGQRAERASRTTELAGFRRAFYGSLTAWADALFELCDAALCAPAPVGSVPSLSLEPVFRRSHGSLYKALARGRIDSERLRSALLAHRPADWPPVFAVDASTWDRCDAETSPERGFYYSASKHSAGQPIVAGWSYQWISQLDWAPDSWTAPLDARRIPPRADTVAATIAQVQRLVGRLPDDGQLPLFVFDAGYDPIALGAGLAAVGRGASAGQGKTCGRGVKGQRARKGGYHKVGFEGGQMPLQRRLPKRGFKSTTQKYNAEVSLSDLQRLGAAEVDMLTLKQAKLIGEMTKNVKVIKSGELSIKVALSGGILATAGARAAIEAAGGSIA